ncbi:MAG TPA: hypothetical protein VF715_08535 [Thermoleophilaceae bacterium]
MDTPQDDQQTHPEPAPDQLEPLGTIPEDEFMERLRRSDVQQALERARKLSDERDA